MSASAATGSSCCPSRPSPSPTSSTTWLPNTSEWARAEAAGVGTAGAPATFRRAEPPGRAEARRPPGALRGRPEEEALGVPRAGILARAGIFDTPEGLSSGAECWVSFQVLRCWYLSQVSRVTGVIKERVPLPLKCLGTGVGRSTHQQLGGRRASFLLHFRNVSMYGHTHTSHFVLILETVVND